MTEIYGKNQKGTKMKQRMQTETEKGVGTKKKKYSLPRIEAIGEVRDITRGTIGEGADSISRYQTHVPSDPNG